MTNEQAGSEPRETLQRMIDGYRTTQLIAVAAQLGIADLLADGPRSADDLAAATNSHPDALYRTLRALAAIGVFAETDGRRFALTPLSELLRASHPDSSRALAIHTGADVYRSYAELAYTVATGENAFHHIYGMSNFEYLAAHPDASEVFNQVMSAGSKRVAAVVLAAYDFSWAHTIVDVAGGQGVLLTAILQANRSARGVLFDQPHVVASAETLLREAGVADRCEIVGGDFFVSVPPDGDLYTLRNIIHDWDDERSVLILRSCAQAMRPQGRVALIEMVIGEPNSAQCAPLLDMTMMLLPGGRERTAEEFARLFTAAGLRLKRIAPTQGAACVIEAERA